MNECVACHVDYCIHANVRLFSMVVCDHCICEPCIPRLFAREREVPCPVCGVTVRAETISNQGCDVLTSAVLVQHKLDAAFSKTEDDCRDATEHGCKEYRGFGNIWKLVNSPSPGKLQDNLWHIDSYGDENADQNTQACGSGIQRRRKSGSILGIISEDGEHVSSDWTPRYESPFQPHIRSLFSQSVDIMEPFQIAETSPWPAVPPSPYGDDALTDIPRHMSGGGQAPDTDLKKARQFFMTDMIAAASKCRSED